MRYFATLFSLLLFAACHKVDPDEAQDETIYKQQMRDFVVQISRYAKAQKPGFVVIPQNGIELVSSTGNSAGQPSVEYLAAIDGNGQEDLFYGYDNDDQATTARTTDYLKSLLDISRKAGKQILVTDYCATPAKMDRSYRENNRAGYVSFAATQRELNVVPVYPARLPQENSADIFSLSQVKNFLYLINPADFTTKADFIAAVRATNYDLLITDLFFHDGTAFTAAETTQLRSKANGGHRLVISYLSIGEAEDYRYYWQPQWASSKPAWLDAENPDWQGNFKVKYWHPEWQRIIYGNDASYLKKVLDAGFDGVYLDIIDAFEYYENR